MSKVETQLPIFANIKEGSMESSKFSLLLNNVNGESFDAAQGISPSPVLNDTVALGQVPPGCAPP
jgi:hypothetical protein